MIKIFTKKTLSAFAILCISSGLVNAQITLQTTNLPTSADFWNNKTITDTTIQQGSSGANVTWDYSLFPLNPTTLTENFDAPSTSGTDATFPGANLKTVSYFGWTDYYINTGSAIEYLGFYSPANEIHVTNSQSLLTVPFSYGSATSNVAVTGTGSSGSVLTGTISTIADAWGTLKVGTSTYTNVLRVKYDYNLDESLGAGLETFIHIVKYTWYRSGLRAPAMQISILDINGQFGNVHQKFTTVANVTTGIADVNKPEINFGVFPNPVKDKAAVKISLDRPSEVVLNLMDITGRVWKNETTSLSQGEHVVMMDLSDLPKGIYLLSATAGANRKEQRIILEN